MVVARTHRVRDSSLGQCHVSATFVEQSLRGRNRQVKHASFNARLTRHSRDVCSEECRKQAAYIVDLDISNQPIFSLNAYCSGISSVIKPRLGDIPINPLLCRNLINSRSGNERRVCRLIVFHSLWKKFDKN